MAQDIREIGAHRLPQPACFGGAQAALRDHPLAVATAAEGCVAAGWCLAVWSAHNWMNSALASDEPMQRLWRDVHAVRIHAILTWDAAAATYIDAVMAKL